MSDEPEGFLKRWSRRKAAEEPAAVTETAEERPIETIEPTVEGKPDEKPEEPFDLSKLPSIESLGKDSDYSMFMHKAVPDDLRLKALRRMWTTDPVLAAPDLLDMHAWDYTGNDGIKPLVTPALQAIAAAAREALERARKSAESADKPAEQGVSQSSAGEEQEPAPPTPVKPA
jgi:hypothetical protein